jgi:hypothetical protein
MRSDGSREAVRYAQLSGGLLDGHFPDDDRAQQDTIRPILKQISTPGT